MTDFRSYMSSEYFAENQMVADLDTALKQISDTFVKPKKEQKQVYLDHCSRPLIRS
jgi:hypothetical protein